LSEYGKNSGLSYGSYLHIPQLLDQQQCLTKPEAHDELQFIIVHQVYELWFKLILHEMDEIRRLVDTGTDVALHSTIRLCRRVTEIMKVLVGQIHVLETMRPADFLRFRNHLKPASGFQSVQFREFESALGLKDEKLASYTSDDPRHEALLARMQQPSLIDALYSALSKRGLKATPPSPERTDEQARVTMASLKTIYDDPDTHPLLYDLCEAVVDVDEQVILWRRHHVMMVERQIGSKPGTGQGTTGELDGIRYLKTTLSRRAFPDLWEVRTLLKE
jgi:tryptophan 2,3-dioxygenase